jgi:hypothetical protein
MNISKPLNNLSIKPDGYFKGYRIEMMDFSPVPFSFVTTNIQQLNLPF